MSVGASTKVKMLIWSVFQSCKTKRTDGQAWSIIQWSLQAIYKGKHPYSDHTGKRYDKNTAEGQLAGTDLAGGFFGVIWSIKADLDYYTKNLQLKHYTADSPCEYCGCDKKLPGPMKPMTFGPTCQWKHRCFTGRQWRDQHESLHPIFRSFVFLSCLNVEADELHVLWLGVAQYLLGSVLWLLVFKKLVSMADVWGSIVDSGGSLYTNMVVKFFVDERKPKTSWPKLKGRGAQVKSLVGPLLQTWARYMDKAVVFDVKVCECLELLLEISDLVDLTAKQTFMPEQDCIKLLQCVEALLDLYTWLGLRSDEAGDCLFSAAPKLHWLWHMAYRSIYLHPRRVSCWLDEDYMKHIKRLASSATNGVARHLVPRQVVEKYRQSMAFWESIGS